MSGFTTTPNYGLRKPVVGADNDAWGGDLNFDLDTLDTQLKTVSTAQSGYLPLAGGTCTGPVIGISFAVSGDTWVVRGYSPDIVWSIRDTSGNIPLAVMTDGTVAIARVPTPTTTAMPTPRAYVEANFLPAIGGVVNIATTFNQPVTLPAAARFFTPPEGGFAFSVRDVAGNVAFGVDTEGVTVVGSLIVTKGSPVPNPPFVLPTSPGPSGTWWNNGTFICVVP